MFQSNVSMILISIPCFHCKLIGQLLGRLVQIKEQQTLMQLMFHIYFLNTLQQFKVSLCIIDVTQIQKFYSFRLVCHNKDNRARNSSLPKMMISIESLSLYVPRSVLYPPFHVNEFVCGIIVEFLTFAIYQQNGFYINFTIFLDGGHFH